MKTPKMILFDYGQTLLDEKIFDGEAGFTEVLKHVTKNPYDVTAKQLNEFSWELNKEIPRYYPEYKEKYRIEVHDNNYYRYIYEYFKLEFDIDQRELFHLYWDFLSPCEPVKHMDLLLKYLRDEKIRTGIISNISFSEGALQYRINRAYPEHEFEFIIASSEYVFRKPSRRIFELALRKADLNASEVVYCGDSVYFDISGAANAGIFPVWFTGATRDIEEPNVNHLKIADWKEMIEWMEGMKR
ncbi:MAG: HAD family hydrolase [Lachnospiraceae bacterium]|nr:HAD family hydrolase [Lachnospiraceae bacterium]